jgi:hypothetical protein
MDEDAEILARRLLADEFIEALGPQGLVRILRGAFRRGDAGGVGGHQPEMGKMAQRAQTHASESR